MRTRATTRARAATLAAVVGVGLVAAGCATSADVAPAAFEPGVVPRDLTIEVIVQRGGELPERWEAQLRPARFVLYPDGALHYQPEEDERVWAAERTQEQLRERVLTHPEVVTLWSRVAELGFADPAAGREPFNFDQFEVANDATVYLVSITAGGDRWAFVRESRGDPPDDAPIVLLVRELAALVWVTDRPRPRLLRLIDRYDFGPDPYARFREP